MRVTTDAKQFPSKVGLDTYIGDPVGPFQFQVPSSMVPLLHNNRVVQ